MFLFYNIVTYTSSTKPFKLINHNIVAQIPEMKHHEVKYKSDMLVQTITIITHYD
jgi:hypothetical protein